MRTLVTRLLITTAMGFHLSFVAYAESIQAIGDTLPTFEQGIARYKTAVAFPSRIKFNATEQLVQSWSGTSDFNKEVHQITFCKDVGRLAATFILYSPTS